VEAAAAEDMPAVEVAPEEEEVAAAAAAPSLAALGWRRWRNSWKLAGASLVGS